MAWLDELERLQKLREAGALTDEEFEAEKVALSAAHGKNAEPPPVAETPNPDTSTEETEAPIWEKRLALTKKKRSANDDVAGKAIMLIGGFALMAVLLVIAATSSKPSPSSFDAPIPQAIAEPQKPPHNPKDASAIIMRNLRSPDSFEYINGKTYWTGTSPKGDPAYVALISYNAQNGFGALLRGCIWVAYSETSDQKLNWNTAFGTQEADRVMCDQIGSDSDGPLLEVAKSLAELNFKSDDASTPSSPTAPEQNNICEGPDRKNYGVCRTPEDFYSDSKSESEAQSRLGLPKLTHGESYDKVRSKMLSNGWSPYRPSDAYCAENSCEYKTIDKPETIDCAGTGLGNCEVGWRKGTATAYLCTAGEEPVYTGVCGPD